MNAHTAKIAVSLSAKTLRAVESERLRLGRSRSSVVAEALEAWLARTAASAADRRYAEGYARLPEPEEAPLASAVMATWDDWDESAKSKRSSKKRGK